MMFTSGSEERVKLFHKLIADRRRELGITQRQLAEKIGLTSNEYIAQVEGGKREMHPERIPLVADALFLNRRKVVMLYLYEQTPTNNVYRALFGSELPNLNLKD